MAFPGDGTRPESIFVDDTRSVVGAEVACVPGSNRNPSDLTDASGEVSGPGDQMG